MNFWNKSFIGNFFLVNIYQLCALEIDLWVKKLLGITQGSLHFCSEIVSTEMELSNLLNILAI